MLDLEPLLDSTLDATDKGFPAAAAPCRVRDVGTRGWRLFAGDLPLPQALLRESALAHNAAWMRDFTAATGVLLAPHGKTTMAPQIFDRQLAAGAWGMTVATVQQLAVCARFGVRRVLMANQLLGGAEVAGVLALLAEHPHLEFCCLVDSPAQVAMLEAMVAQWDARAARREAPVRRPEASADRRRPDASPPGSPCPCGPLSVLIELGIPGGRTGCRTYDEALALAGRIATSPVLALAGLECYEGGLVSGDSAADAAAVGALMQRMRAVALACDARGFFTGAQVILSAGGSAAFDIVARELPTRLARPVLTILRSGCYVTHDAGFYARLLEGVRSRSGAAWQARPGLLPALEVWARVQSCPEPGLAILTMGKRDVSFDFELPRPVKLVRCRPGAAAEPVPVPVPAGWGIAALNDQHAYLRYPRDDSGAPQVGDLVGCGISHPCTTFDKWRVLFTVDDDYRVTGAIRTHF